jgi:hypothetical protein
MSTGPSTPWTLTSGVSERREAYRAKFSVGDEDSEDVYAAELDEATWQTLKVGLRCRLKVGALSGEVKQVISVAAKNDGRRSGAGRRRTGSGR